MRDSEINSILKKLVNRSPYLHPMMKFIITFRFLFFLVAAAGIWIDKTEFTGRSLIGIYSLIMLLFGVIYPFYWQGVFQSFLVTVCRYAFAQHYPPGHMNIFIFQWFSYFAIWFAVSLLVKNNTAKRENLINITTAFAKALDSRDKYTAFHSENVARYAEKIAMEMGLSEKKCNEIKLGALLHDIGKIGIPEHILNKPGKLTKEEFEVIKGHPLIGYEMLKEINLFEKKGILEIILYHHEREDGSGYPYGIKSEEISLPAKIVAVADCFDAIISNRSYKDVGSFAYAVNEIVLNKGTWYDPEVVDAFYQIIEREGEGIVDVNKTKHLEPLGLSS